MAEFEPRRARASDVEAITSLVRAAYAKYVPRMGTEPMPMRADYGEAVRRHQVWVVEEGGGLIAVLELVPQVDHLLVENVAVDPARQGRGLGRRLMAFAETEALRQGLPEMRLYTAEAMTGNIGLYARMGYAETERKTVHDIPRVYMSKRIEA